MASQPFDTIVIGARCAGYPTAMLLARKACRVLVTLPGAPGTAGEPVAHSPRRTPLEKSLVEAAAKSGAEGRQL